MNAHPRCRLVRDLLIVAVLLVGGAASAASDATWRSSFGVDRAHLASSGSSPYLVLEPGSRLHYAHRSATLTVSVLDETRLVDGVETRVVEEREEKDGKPTEVSRNYLAIDRTTNDVYSFGEDSEEYKNGAVVSREGSWLAGVSGAKFGLLVPGAPKVGDRFQEEIAPKIAMDRGEVVAIDATLTVPAGTYHDCLRIVETSPLERGRSEKWYAPGVGMIKDDDLVLVKIDAPAAGGAFEVTSIALPGAPADGVMLDYLAIDRARHRVWVPAGGTGNTDVIDTGSGEVRSVGGFPTAEVERRGKKRRVGPSSASVGDGFVYVGNRGDSTVCAVDATTLEKAGCVTLSSMPDGVAFVARSKEVWVTMPREQTIAVLDVAAADAPKLAATIKLEGDPEGYAVDNTRGAFYTNLEDKDRTLRINIATRKVTATWTPECGEAGPRCLAVEPTSGRLMVACTDHVEVLDPGRDGAIVSKLDTGAGVDSIDYVPELRSLYVAAARAAKLTVARLDDAGTLTRTAEGRTADGARNAVATQDGAAYVGDGAEGKILVLKPAPGH